MSKKNLLLEAIEMEAIVNHLLVRNLNENGHHGGSCESQQQLDL